MGEMVQITLPVDAVVLCAKSLKTAAMVLETQTEQTVDQRVIDQLRELEEFMVDVSEHPRGFRPTGRMATALKTRARRADGIRRNDGSIKDDLPRPQPPRKRTRHERRLDALRARRLSKPDRALLATAYNAARASLVEAGLPVPPFVNAVADGKFTPAEIADEVVRQSEELTAQIQAAEGEGMPHELAEHTQD